MSHTDGRWTQGSASSDLTIFIGADKFVDFAAVATLPAAPAAGLLYKTVGNNAVAKFFASLDLLLRSGQFATAAFSQSQFGTAAAQPGPSSVAGTSGPLALNPGFPPVTAANMSTVGGTVGAAPMTGPLPKGIQINSFDVVYQVLGLAAAAATVGLTRTKFVNLAAPVVSNIVALGANGLPTVIGAQPQVTTVTVTSPAMIVPVGDTEVILNVNLTGGATGTVNFYGVNLNCSFNFN
jgi:hypothetical protein